MKNIIIVCSFLLFHVNLLAQTFPVKENNCFQYFNPNATGRNDVNAYLLSYLSRIVYPQYLADEFNTTIRPTDTARFKQKFIERTRHFFVPATFKSTNSVTSTIKDINVVSNAANGLTLQNVKTVEPAVQFEWVWKSDGVGKNPEAMVIGTPTAVFVVFRGTDRVEGATPFMNQVGEWVFTDFNVLPQKPCSSCNVVVHQGFYQSLQYAGFRSDLVQVMRRFKADQKKIWITGHSLGGGMAQLFAYLLKKMDGLEAQGVYVFNSPHPGDEAYAREMDAIFTNSRVQRFEFLTDPIASGPPQTINWIPGVTKWGRAGTRNYFSKETIGGYAFNKTERSGVEDMGLLSVVGGLANMGGMCFHHPTWLTRATHNLLSADMQSKLPNPPPRIAATDEGCNGFDVNQGVSGNLLDPGTDIIAGGIYRIKGVVSNRYLQSTGNCGINGCCDLQQDNLSTGTDVQWRLSLVPNALFTSYTIQSVLNNKVVDADAPFTGTDGCKVHLCGRLSAAVGLRTNQEWRLVKLPNGNYRIRCVAGDRFIRVSPGCATSDGCRFELNQTAGTHSEFQLIKVN